jgi:peptide/nickel transport system permease protein
MLAQFNWRRFGLVAMTLPVVVLIFAASALAPLIAPYDPYALDVMVMLQGPSAGHLMGTDELGRDVLSRVIHASQISITVGLVAVLIGAAGGTLIGIVAAFFGGVIDALLMRFMDIVFCFPAILLAVILMANLGTSVLNAMLAIGIIFIPGFARLTRAVAQTVQRQSFLEAAICLGMPGHRIITREILPNVIGPVVVEAAVAFSYAVLLESALSFLGLGAQPPEPSWGNMINTGRGFMERAPWLGIVPGLAMFFCVLGFNLLGDGLRDYFDPHLRD